MFRITWFFFMLWRIYLIISAPLWTWWLLSLLGKVFFAFLRHCCIEIRWYLDETGGSLTVVSFGRYDDPQVVHDDFALDTLSCVGSTCLFLLLLNFFQCHTHCLFHILSFSWWVCLDDYFSEHGMFHVADWGRKPVVRDYGEKNWMRGKHLIELDLYVVSIVNLEFFLVIIRRKSVMSCNYKKNLTFS